MELIVNEQTEISLNQLVEQQQAGFSVTRSPHVGNNRLYNLVLANAGIDMLQVDHNIVGKDTSYYPGMVIADQTATTLTDDGGLAMRTSVTSPVNGESVYLDELHIASTVEAFPDANIFTATSFLRDNETVSAEITNICADLFPEMFTRQVRQDDNTAIQLPAGTPVSASDILQLQDDFRTDAGVLIPNEADIMINFVVDCLNSGRSKQYHLSGPAMFVYMREDAIKQRMARLASAISQSPVFAGKLPEQLEVELVDTTGLTLASTKDGAIHLLAFIDALEEKERVSAKVGATKKAFYQGPDKANRTMAEAINQEGRDLEADAIAQMNASARLCPDFTDLNDGLPLTTQYDCLNKGGLFVPDMCKQLTMAQLLKLRKTVRKSLSRSQDPT